MKSDSKTPAPSICNDCDALKCADNCRCPCHNKRSPAPSSALSAPTERKHFNTENSRYSSGELCRLNGWTIGTRLIGNEGYGPTVIQLSGIGEDSILARQISHNGIPAENPRECSWTLHCRDWRVAGAESGVPLDTNLHEAFVCAMGRIFAGADRKQAEEIVEGYIREFKEGKTWPK